MAAFIETGRSFVNAWECDENDHYNVQFFAAKKDEAQAHFRLALGLPPFNLPDSQMHVSTVYDHVRFHGELRVADMFAIRSGIVEWRDTTCVAYHEMRHASTGRLSATYTSRWDHTNAATGNPAPWSGDCRALAEQYRVDLPDDAQRRSTGRDGPLPDVTLQQADDKGFMSTYKGIVLPGDCDASGCMTTRHYVARSSDAAAHVWNQVGIDYKEGYESGLGTVAVENFISYRHPLRAGDLILLKSCVHHVGRKTMSFAHLIFNAASGRIAATLEVTAVLMDLDQRRATEFDPRIRTKMEKAIVKL